MNHVAVIRARLVADATVSGLVGTKVFAQVAKQGESAPYVVISTVSDVPQHSLTGSPSTRLHIARMQIDSYGRTYAEAHALADAVEQVVGALIESELSAFLDSSTDLYDDTHEPPLHRVSADYFVNR